LSTKNRINFDETGSIPCIRGCVVRVITCNNPNSKKQYHRGYLRQLLSSFKDVVADRNNPEIKKFVSSYVEKVIIYKEHVELILKLHITETQNPQPHEVVDLHGGGDGSRTPVRKYATYASTV
jgi:hypothetical protein